MASALEEPTKEIWAWLESHVLGESLQVAELKRRWLEADSDSVVLLDLRSPEEYQAGHVRSAINVPGAVWKQLCDDSSGAQPKKLGAAAQAKDAEDIKEALLQRFVDEVLLQGGVLDVILAIAQQKDDAEHLKVAQEVEKIDVHSIHDVSDVLGIGRFFGHSIKKHVKQKVSVARPLALCIALYVGNETETPILDAFGCLLKAVLSSEELLEGILGPDVGSLCDSCGDLPIVSLSKQYDAARGELAAILYTAPEAETPVAGSGAAFRSETGSPHDDVVTLLPGMLYVGPSEVFTSNMEALSQQPQEEFMGKYLASLEDQATHWARCRDMFEVGLRRNTVPTELRERAQYTDAKGKRLRMSVKKNYLAKEKNGHHGWSKLVRFSKFMHVHSSTMFETYFEEESHTEEDDNVTVATYRFPNKLAFSHHFCKQIKEERRPYDSELLGRLASFFYCMNACNAEQRPVYLALSDITIPAVLGYLVNTRLWPVSRAFGYVAEKFPLEKYGQYWQQCAQPVRLLLNYEKNLNGHYWPSMSMSLAVTYMLGVEAGLRGGLDAFAHPHAAQLVADFYNAVRSNNHKLATSLIADEPLLAYARTSVDENDMTPLMLMLQTNSPLLDDAELVQALSLHPSLRLTDFTNRDALCFAIENGGLHADQLLQFGAPKLHRARGTHGTPLHRAIELHRPVHLVKLLVDESTANVRDGYYNTASHAIVGSLYQDEEKLELLEALVESKADLFMKDCKGKTVLDLVGEDPKYGAPSPFYLKAHHLAYALGYERYRFDSFAQPRPAAAAESFVDGEATFAQMAKDLRGAKRVLYITDWWLTPEMYLVRPSVDADGPFDREAEPWKSNQLFSILTELVSQQPPVQVFILIWDNIMEDLQSQQSKEKLEALGPSVQVLTHGSGLVQGWTNHQKIVVVDEEVAWVGGLDMCLHRWDTTDHCAFPRPVFVGKDYYHPLFAGAGDMAKPWEDYPALQERTQPRMGWHDLSFRTRGLPVADVCTNFVQRWNHVVESRADVHYRVLDPPSEQQAAALATAVVEGDACGVEQVQVVRSVGSWSAGFRVKEMSVMHAIKAAIEAAETFVYIETQFFISVQGDVSVVNLESREVESLADVIAHRIKRAFLERKPFKVVMVLPVHPEGDPGDFVTKRIMYHQHKTISHIRRTLREDLKGHLVTADDYITYYALANHALMREPARIVQQQIYVHAKLLITDTTSICGSANLNMRSLAGDRDSEIALVVESRSFANDLRERLWAEHMGCARSELLGSALADYPRWQATARGNTHWYRALFEEACPFGDPLTYKAWMEAERALDAHWQSRSEASVEATFQELCSNVKGHLMEFPHYFLHHDVRGTSDVKISAQTLFSPASLFSFMGHLEYAAIINVREDLMQ